MGEEHIMDNDSLTKNILIHLSKGNELGDFKININDSFIALDVIKKLLDNNFISFSLKKVNECSSVFSYTITKEGLSYLDNKR